MNLKDLPIQRKLTVFVLLISGAALLLTSVAFITYDLLAFRKELIKEMETTAGVIAANSTAALAFHDDKAAREILSALAVDDTIVAAALYDAGGNLFVIYPKTASEEEFPASPLPFGHKFERGNFLVFYPVQVGDSHLGSFYLKSDLAPLYQRLELYGLIVFLVICAALVLAFLLSRWLQRSISNPILDLASAAKIVSEKKDYSVRVKRFGNDELGQLTEAFNEMLQEIDLRDAALRTNQERLQLALSASQTGTWDWDIEKNKFTWDQFTHVLFGLPQNVFDGTYESFVNLIHPQDRVAFSETLEETLRTGKEFNSEFQVVWPDGSLHQIAIRGRTTGDKSGKPIRMAGVCLDITDRKRIEEAIRNLNVELEQRVLLRTAELTASTREMEAFTYSVSHDLRAPLRHIVAFAEILEDEFGKQLDPAAQDYIHRIMHGARSMSHLVDDLLNLARIGRLGVVRQTVNLNKLIEEVISDLSQETRERKIEWRIENFSPVKCDPGLVKQVFANLISNSIKYTRPRTMAVIEIGKEKRGREKIFFVRDNGVGFNMKFADKLFGVFQRLHRAEDFEGTGVGLATVERIIQKHGGRVWADSEVDKGATFYFTLEPRKEEDFAQPPVSV